MIKVKTYIASEISGMRWPQDFVELTDTGFKESFKNKQVMALPGSVLIAFGEDLLLEEQIAPLIPFWIDFLDGLREYAVEDSSVTRFQSQKYIELIKGEDDDEIEFRLCVDSDGREKTLKTAMLPEKEFMKSLISHAARIFETLADFYESVDKDLFSEMEDNRMLCSRISKRLGFDDGYSMEIKWIK